MKTKTVGEMLKDERLVHRISLEEISKRTRIRLEYLQSLENNEFEKLPAATFVKGYIKAYAKLFGIEAAPLLALLRRDYKESAKGTLVPREFIRPSLTRQKFWTPVTMLVLVVATVFFTLFSYVGAQWYNLNRPPELTVLTPENEAVVAAQVIVKGQTEPEAIVLVNAKPVALQPDGSFETQVFLPREGVSSITVEATDRRGKSTLVQKTVTVKF